MKWMLTNTLRLTKPGKIKRSIEPFLKQNRFSNRTLLAFGTVFAIVGAYFIFQSFAASLPAIEPENGTLTTPASLINDAGASAGKAVRFGTGTGTGIPAEFCPNQAAGQCRPYNPDGPWNSPIDPGVGVNPNSSAYINRIMTKAAGSNTLTSDTTQCTIPVYLFSDSTPRASVHMNGYFSYYDNGDNSRIPPPGNPGATIPNVPIPAVAASEGGCDSQITFWNPNTGEEWAFWLFGGTAGTGYSAENGWRYSTISNNNGRFADGLAGRGAGTPYFAGLVRPWEIAQGHIDHALAFAYSGPSPNFVYPASKSDGGGFGGVAGVDPPEGTRLQLNPNLTDADFTAWGLNAEAKVTAKALQKYGAYIIDNSGSTKVYFELQATANWDTSKVNRNFLSSIPLGQFRVVDSPPAPAGGAVDQTAPTAPTGATATAGNGQVTVRWNAATDDIGVSGYIVRYRAAGNTGSFTDVDVPDPRFLAFTVTGLTNAQGYNFFVRAKDASGKISSDSNLAQATPTSSATNPAVSKVNGNCPAVPSAAYGSSSINVNVSTAGTYHVWSRIRVPDATNNSFLIQAGNLCEVSVGGSGSIAPGNWVWVNYKDGNTASPADLTLPSGNTTVLMSGTKSGVEVDRVLLVDDNCVPSGIGDNCLGVADTTPPAISSVASSSVTTSGSTISWTTDETSDSQIDYGTNISYGSSTTLSTSMVTSHSVNLSGLSASTTYHYRVKSKDASDNLATSGDFTFTTSSTPDTTPPTASMSAPADGATISGSSVTLSANASDNVGVAGVQFYSDYAGDPNSNKQGAEDTSSPYSTVLNTTTLSNGSHTLTAIARDAAGNTTQANTVTVTVNNAAPPPPDTTAPPTPTGLNSPSKTNTSVSLAWNAVNDTPGGTVSGLAGYKLYRSVSGGSFSFLQSTTSLNYSDSGLSASTTYAYKVTAYDNANNESAQTSSVSVTTNANPPPPAPTVSLSASPTSLNSGSASTLSWSSTNATSCSATGSWSGTKATSGSQSTGNLSASATYNLACSGAGGSANASASVTVNAAPPPPPPPVTTKVPGDCNLDQHVTLVDLSILLTNYNHVYSNADFNSSGQVDLGDLSILLTNYGKY